MKAKTPRKPTDSELDILGILWELGPSTVADVHQALVARKPTGYTTVLKLLQIMLEKGLVQRDDSRRQHVYEAATRQDVVQRHLIRDLLDRAFDGSAQSLVMHALSIQKTSPGELNEIRRLLDRLEGGKR